LKWLFNSKTDIQTVMKAIYRVGSLYFTTENVNPGTWMTGTTWTAWGSGRVPVGVNTSDTDFNTVEKEGGAKTHTLTIAQIPSHNHTYQEWYAVDDVGNSGGGYPCMNQRTGTTGSTGEGTAHNNLQPYITCYMFKRTA
jgi:hypothetical protein